MTAEVDAAVRRVMARGRIPQGYSGTIDVSRPAVRAWFEAAGPLTAWWFAFVSAVQAEHRAVQQLLETRAHVSHETAAARARPGGLSRFPVAPRVSA